MPENAADLLQYAVQLPLVGIIIGVVYYFVKVMREERSNSDKTREVERVAFLEALDKERQSREAHSDKLDVTLTGLNTSMNTLGHAVNELRTDVRGRTRD